MIFVNVLGIVILLPVAWNALKKTSPDVQNKGRIADWNQEHGHYLGRNDSAGMGQEGGEDRVREKITREPEEGLFSRKDYRRFQSNESPPDDTSSWLGYFHADDPVSFSDLDSMLENGATYQQYWLIIKSFVQKAISYIDQNYLLQNDVIFASFKKFFNLGDELNVLRAWIENLDPELVKFLSNSVKQNKWFEELQFYIDKAGPMLSSGAEELLTSEYYSNFLESLLEALIFHIGTGYSRTDFDDYISFMTPNSTIFREVISRVLPGKNHVFVPGKTSGTLRKISQEAVQRRSLSASNKRDYSYDYGGYGHNSGYGGGGCQSYGNNNQIDPFNLLTTLLLGALLGFLLANLTPSVAIVIGKNFKDDDVLLMLTDLPEEGLTSRMFKEDEPGNVSRRQKREISKESLVSEEAAQQTGAGLLNGLWTVHQRTRDPTCTRQFLCENVYSKMSIFEGRLGLGTALLLVSLNNLLGHTGSGPNLDKAFENVTAGHLDSFCPRSKNCSS